MHVQLASFMGKSTVIMCSLDMNLPIYCMQAVAMFVWKCDGDLTLCKKYRVTLDSYLQGQCYQHFQQWMDYFKASLGNKTVKASAAEKW